MPRSIWNGVISFGMVSIPVKLFTAVESKDVSFHMLHSVCNGRMRQLRWCPVCERKVEREEVIRGYEYARDQHVAVTDEDFEKLPLPSKHTIDITAFVRAEEIDPVYYEKSYYLEPEETGIKPFALMIRGFQEKQLTGIGKIAIRDKERLCTLRPMDGALILDTLHYPDEIKIEKGEKLPEVKISDKEMDMAFALMDLLSEPFQPEKYQDDYRKAIKELIEIKLQGQEQVEVPEAPSPAPIIDLMTALKASVEAAKKRKGEEEEREPAGGRSRRRAAG